MANNRIIFAQLNLQKSRSPMIELQKYPFDIALVQEPNIDKKDRLSVLQSSKRSFNKGRARAAVIVNQSHHHWPIDPLSTSDLAVVALEMNSDKRSLYVASCYLDITKDAPSAELDYLVKYCHDKRIPLIVGADTNAHSPMWGEVDTNKRGGDLEEWITACNLTILNRGSTCTFYPDYRTQGTIIDITLANEWSREQVHNWRVELGEPSLSDHRKILFHFGGEVAIACNVGRSYKKVKWTEYCKQLKKYSIWDAWEKVEVEAFAEALHDNLLEALDSLVPKKARQIREKFTWWNESFETKRKILRHMYNKRFIHERTLQKYKELKRTFNLEIRNAKRNSWKDFCTKAESARDISKIVQIIENPPKRLMSVLQKDGSVLNPVESLDHLLQTHFPDSIVSTNINADRLGETDFTGICEYITPPKVRAAFKSFGDFKAPGPDEIPPIALKNLDDQHLYFVTMLYKLSLATGQVPMEWRKMRVVFIPKAGKSDYAIAKAYRPITLSNFTLKGVERLIQWYIVEHVLPRPLYKQHAYTKGRSCDTALSEFISDVEQAVLNKQYVLAISLDCTGAFDRIMFSSAERCMTEKKIPNNIIRWYMNLLRGRQVTAEVQGISSKVVPARGSPQGGVLSPLIWNLIMDELLVSFKRGPVKAIGYADDVLLYVTGRFPLTLAELIQPELDRVVKWGKTNGLSFNPLKTNAVLFTRNKRKIPKPVVTMGDKALELQSSFKYLGVEIQSNLSWRSHIQDRTNKCKFLLIKCKDLVNRRWGLTPNKMDWIYKAVVRPKITYGALVWAPYINKSDTKRLNKVQRLALLSVTQPLRSAPTAGLETMLGWIPLHIHAQEIGLCAFARLHGRNKGQDKSGHHKIWRRKLEGIIPYEFPQEDTEFNHIWHENVQQLSADKLTMTVYTDASRAKDCVGMAWIANIDDEIIAENYYSAKDINIHQAEMIAIKEALSWIKCDLRKDYNVIILCDSQSTVLKLKNYMASDPTSIETMKLLRDARLSHFIDIKWIRGHNNVTGNEIADFLAKKGMLEAQSLSSTYPFLPVSHKWIKDEIRKYSIKNWQYEWSLRSDCRVSRLFMPTVRTKKKTIEMSLYELHKLSMIVTGHGLFKRHLRHWNEIECSLCELCQEDDEDSWHLWDLCPKLTANRRHINELINKGMPQDRALLRFFQVNELQQLEASNEALIVPSG